jgi:hypothetical protein
MQMTPVPAKKSAIYYAVATLVVIALVAAAYVWVALSWSYSSGERAGFMQKMSHKGWLCKTWEGELSMVAMPGKNFSSLYATLPWPPPLKRPWARASP